MECKLTNLRDKCINVEQNINDLTKNIEDMIALKLKVCILLTKLLFLVILRLVIESP